MILKIISGVLILITTFLSFKHGWAGVTNSVKPEEAKMFTDIGITRPFAMSLAIASLLIGLMVLFPQTFFMGNVINAVTILIIMSLALRAGNTRIALIEIPFLIMPLVLIYLGHPLRK